MERKDLLCLEDSWNWEMLHADYFLVKSVPIVTIAAAAVAAIVARKKSGLFCCLVDMKLTLFLRLLLGVAFIFFQYHN